MLPKVKEAQESSLAPIQPMSYLNILESSCRELISASGSATQPRSVSRPPCFSRSLELRETRST